MPILKIVDTAGEYVGVVLVRQGVEESPNFTRYYMWRPVYNDLVTRQQQGQPITVKSVSDMSTIVLDPLTNTLQKCRPPVVDIIKGFLLSLQGK